MKWCRIALTRLSCETMHRLDQLTVHQLLRCEVIHHSSLKEGGGSCWAWSALLQKRWWGVGARRGAKGSLAQRGRECLGVSRLKLNERRQTVESDEGSRARRSRLESDLPAAAWCRSRSRGIASRYTAEMVGRILTALVAPLLHMPKCVCRSVLQERGCPVSLSACPTERFDRGPAAACLVQRHQPVLVPCFR